MTSGGLPPLPERSVMLTVPREKPAPPLRVETSTVLSVERMAAPSMVLLMAGLVSPRSAAALEPLRAVTDRVPLLVRSVSCRLRPSLPMAALNWLGAVVLRVLSTSPRVRALLRLMSKVLVPTCI